MSLWLFCLKLTEVSKKPGTSPLQLLEMCGLGLGGGWGVLATGQPCGPLTLGGAGAHATPPLVRTPSRRGCREANRPGGGGCLPTAGSERRRGMEQPGGPCRLLAAGSGLSRGAQTPPGHTPEPGSRTRLPVHHTEQLWGGKQHPRGSTCCWEIVTLSQGLCPDLS